jgi:predicted enzyme related to lactoylglutathione lyase
MGQPVVHFEILGKDADRTQSYYADLFGWKIEPLPFDNPTDYGLIGREGNTNITFYVEVPDVEAALAKAESLGGKRTMGPDRVPGGPVIGLFEDPDGLTVGVVQGG